MISYILLTTVGFCFFLDLAFAQGSSLSPPGSYQFNSVTCAGQNDGNYTGISYLYGTVFCLQQGVLLAKIDGRSLNWAGTSPMWTDTSTTSLSNFNSESLAFNQIEARFPVYASLSLASINVGFAPFTTASQFDPSGSAVNNIANIAPVLTKPMNYLGVNFPVAQTLAAAMSQPVNSQVATTASSAAYGTPTILGVVQTQGSASLRSAWDLSTGASIYSEPNCNVAGINVVANLAYITGTSGNFQSWFHYPECRIGLIANNGKKNNNSATILIHLSLSLSPLFFFLLTSIKYIFPLC